MSVSRAKSQKGFSLVELAVVCAILMTVMAAVFTTIGEVTQRSQAEQVKTDLTQSGREFVDEFERDLHQAGYPNCRLVATPGAPNCPPDNTNVLVAGNSAVAAGLVYVSNTEIGFEGDVDGNGTVDSIWYRLVDQAGTFPPTGNCPCTIQRSQVPKVAGVLPVAQSGFATFSQELQNVVNSGVGTGPALSYTVGSGLPISGTTKWGGSNTAYYAAISSFKDYPVFTAYDNTGAPIAVTGAGLGLDTLAGQQAIPNIKSIRLTINLLADATTGVDAKNNTRPVETLVGNARLVNCGGQPCD